MRTDEVDLVHVEVVGGPNPLWLTFSLKVRSDPARDPAQLYLLTGDTLLIVDPAQPRGRKQEAAVEVRPGGLLRVAPADVPVPLPAGAVGARREERRGRRP